MGLIRLWQVGSPCVAKFEDDDQWYRAQVRSFSSNLSHCVSTAGLVQSRIALVDRVLHVLSSSHLVHVTDPERDWSEEKEMSDGILFSPAHFQPQFCIFPHLHLTNRDPAVSP